MAYSVCLIPGDGIGPEISEATKLVLEALPVDIEWQEAEAGAHVFEKEGSVLPQATLDTIKRCGTALKGPITTPIGSGFRSVNVQLRQTFDLYACVRPCVGSSARYSDVDLMIVRENTEDLYAGIEFEAGDEATAKLAQIIEEYVPGKLHMPSALSIKPISEFRSERIVRYAFELAKNTGRKKVTAVHKANIMKCTDGLFLRVAEKVAQDYPEIEFNARIVDALCMGMVINPDDYDVLVLPNLYGDIVSDLAAGLVGGLGMAPGANIGESVAIFEATHGSAPDIAGKGLANPTAMILSAALMLDHLGENACAASLRQAVRQVLAAGEVVTADVCPSGKTPATTTQYAQELVKVLSSLA